MSILTVSGLKCPLFWEVLVADFLHYDYNPDDERPDYDSDDDEFDDLLEDEEDEEESAFTELDDEFDTRDDDIESRRWNKKPKKGYRDEDE
jgi:hypothetical protein